MSAYPACPVAKMENLLLATDISKYSEGAVRESINIAKTCGSKLFIVGVAEQPDIREFADTFPLEAADRLEKETSVHLESVKEKARNENVDCETIFRKGPEIYKYIIEEAKNNNAEMIIMGRRGRTGIARLMMGSVTARTIGHSPVNVLVVPKTAKVTFEKILVPTDGSEYSEMAASEAIKIAKRTNSTLLALSVAKKDENLPAAETSVGKLKEYAEKEEVKVEGLTLKGEPYKVIVDTVNDKNVNLIVMGSHGKTGLDRILMGSVTERVIGHAPCAVLVAKQKK